MNPLEPPPTTNTSFIHHLRSWQRDAKTERRHGGHRTGYPTLDNALERPLRPGELIVVGARPGVGKSYLLAELARNNLERNHQTRCLILSLEMPGSDVAERIASIATNTPPRELRASVAADDGADATLIAHDHPWVNRVHIDEQRHTHDTIIPTIDAHARPDIVLIDYLGLIEGTDPRSREYETVSQSVLMAKTAAKHLGVLVILAAQLRRRDDIGPTRDEENVAPRLSDLRSTGQIEAHADRVLGAWRDAEDRSVLYVKVLKNRHGAGTGTTARLRQQQSGKLMEEAC